MFRLALFTFGVVKYGRVWSSMTNMDQYDIICRFTLLCYSLVWNGAISCGLVWFEQNPIQLLWYGLLCPGERESPTQTWTRRLMCWDIAIKRSSFTTCTMYVHIYATYEAREKVCLNLASYGMSSGISCTPKIQEVSIACFRRPCV